MKKLKPTYIFGRHPVADFIERSPKDVKIIFVKNTIKDIDLSELRAAAGKHGIPFQTVSEKEIKRYVSDEVNHQGIVASIVWNFEYTNFREWLGKIDPESDMAVLILDHITDVHNFGAIIRSATAAGISAILVDGSNQAPANPTTFKTSAGTLGLVPIIQVGNITESIKQLQQNKFWVAGLDTRGKQSIWDIDMKGPMAFLIGSEGEAVSELALKNCDFHVNVPLAEGVESLNASVTSALVSFEWRRRLS